MAGEANVSLAANWSTAPLSACTDKVTSGTGHLVHWQQVAQTGLEQEKQ